MKPNKKTVSRSGLLKIKNSSGQFMLSFILLMAALAALWWITSAIITATAIDRAQDVICNLPEWEGKVGGSPPEFVGTTGPDAYNDTIYVGWRISKMIEAAIGFPFEGTRDGITQGIVERVVEIAQSQQTGDPAIRQLGDGIDPASGSKNWPWIPNNSVYVVSCTKTGDRWSFHNLAYRQCAPGEIGEAGQEGESMLVCRPGTPNPPGKYYSCESNVCAEKDCPADGTPCPGNDSSCAADNVGSPCGTAPPNCTAQCAGNAWEIPCGQAVITNSQADIDTCAAQDPSIQLGCPGGNTGTQCAENEYCDNSGSEWQCKPISAALCDTSPPTTPGESGLPLVNGGADCSGQKTEGKYGIECASGICDIEGNDGLGAGSCINPQLSADAPDYEYIIGGSNLNDEKGIALNFNPVENTAYDYPQFCAPTVFCPSCSDQLLEITDLEEGLAFSFNKIKAKGGVLRFKMSARGASGQDNYARIRYNDVQNINDANRVKSEEFIVEVDAPQIGECSLESGGNIVGDSGNKAKTLVKYNWDFGKSETIGPKFCEIIDGSTTQKPFVCDSTQFMISLMKRLQEIRTHYEAGGAEEIANGNALKEFDALLMTDSFSQKFRNDFASYYTRAAFADTPTWFSSDTDGFKNYVLDADHFILNPETISKPGKYHVTIDFAGTQFFTPIQCFTSPCPNELAMTITIGFVPMQTPSSINMDNALYYLPIDGGVMNITTANREGYGIGTSAETGTTNNVPGTETGAASNVPGTETDTTNNVPGTGTAINVPFKSDFGSLQASGGLRPVVGQTLSSFSQTNLRDNRGRILQVKLVFEGNDPKQLVKTAEPNTVLFAPITATPVAIKIPENESLVDNTHYAKYEIVNATPPSENQELAGWTGLAAQRRNAADSPCSDFRGNPLPSKVNDARTGDGGNVRALSFSKGTITNPPKFLVFGSVFYAPRQQSTPGLKTIQNGLQLLTPTEMKDAGSVASLNYTDDPSKFSYYTAHGLRIAYLQDLMDIVNANSLPDTGPICVVTKKQMNGTKLTSIETIYYWNRGVLLNEIVDKDSTLLAPPSTNKDITQFSVTPAMRCQ